MGGRRVLQDGDVQAVLGLTVHSAGHAGFSACTHRQAAALEQTHLADQTGNSLQNGEESVQPIREVGSLHLSCGAAGTPAGRPTSASR